MAHILGDWPESRESSFAFHITWAFCQARTGHCACRAQGFQTVIVLLIECILRHRCLMVDIQRKHMRKSVAVHAAMQGLSEYGCIVQIQSNPLAVEKYPLYKFEEGMRIMTARPSFALCRAFRSRDAAKGEGRARSSHALPMCAKQLRVYP